MTLILTELSQYGIAMVADSALTVPTLLPRERQYIYRVYFGVTKLRPVPKLQSGISFWGEGKIGDIDTDVWLSDFINRTETNYKSLTDFTSLLRDELRENIKPITDPQNLRYGTIGFHVAGYVDHKGNRVPTFWHVHNGQSEVYDNIDPTIVNANNDLPPDVVQQYITDISTKGNEDWQSIRNGDFLTVYAPFIAVMNALQDYLKKNAKVNIPTKSLKGRAEYLAFQVRTIRDLYALSEDLLPSIGGNVAVLTIAPTGIQSYFNPYDATV
jgi:hypothetical protein